jgi:hypothetical protein
VPYEISFTKRVPIPDRDEYINECCVGGDKVIDQLLPAVRQRYADLDTGQEDWGWYIWFQSGAVKLAIDVFTDDPEKGEFRIHLTSRTKRLLFLESAVDTPELEDLRVLVTSALEAWTGASVRVERIERD